MVAIVLEMAPMMKNCRDDSLALGSLALTLASHVPSFIML